MKILSIDCTAKPASVAVVENGAVKSSAFTNIGLTHSQTLMPMIHSVLEHATISLEDIDVYAINAGPGSFTGVRIGVAALKGLTILKDDVVCPVSTLHSMAYNYKGVKDCVICGAMDARCNQVYTAQFRIKGDTVTRLTEDEAITIDDLALQLKNYEEEVILVGDGASLTYNKLKNELPLLRLAPEVLRYQNATGVAFCAQDFLEQGGSLMTSEDVLPIYLRAPQAERELKKRSK